MVLLSKMGRGMFLVDVNEWRPVRTESDGWTASFMCPNGHNLLLCDYTINVKGVVSPAIECPDCDFRAYATLEGWFTYSNG